MGKAKRKAEKLPTSLKVGDRVMVIAGGNKDKRPNKGRVGKILRFVGDRRDRVVVEGVNVIVKHVRAKQPGETSGVRSFEGSIHVSNVMFLPEGLDKPVRLGRRANAEGEMQRGFIHPATKEFVAI